MSDSPDQPLFTVTEKARRRVAEIKASEPDGESLALWIEIIGQRGPDFAYDLYFQSSDEADPGDEVVTVPSESGDLTVVIPADSVEHLRGATLDMSRDLLNPGMVINNPNRPAQPPGPSSPQIEKLSPDDLTGTVEERIGVVLERVINPSIASHGGRAELVAVEDEGTTAYLRLSGGCVGCGMAAVTLSQGIEVAIRESVPEITRVVDVTDHASGTNPYYEAAKK